MEALFLKLVNMSISASWLVLAVVVLRFAMKKAPKWMTCALWAMVAIRLVFPFSIESMFSLIPDPAPIPQTVITNHTPIVSPNTAPIVPNDPAAPMQGILAGQQPSAITPASITELAATVWIIGVSVLLVYALVSYLLIRRKVSASLHLRNNIYLCDYIESPFILGILRPRIYLPSSLDQAQWPHVLAHEQAHLHRRDHWWKPLGFAILCVYWFNPVLWLAYILLCRDIELACDERVIRDMDTRQKQDYTTALLECSMPRYLVAACPLAFGEVGVKERVKSVLNYKKPAFWIILIALILCIAAAVCFLTDPVGESTITPGTYSIDRTLYYAEEWSGWNVNDPLIYDGKYILHNSTLYYDCTYSIIALGNMQKYDLSNAELHSYLRNGDWWQTPFHHIPTISEALWLRLEDGSFYVWFQTTNGETYLGCGVEDYGERYEGASDDTFISHLRRLTRDENAEEKELAWFDATVLEAQTTLLRVTPVYGCWEAEQYGELEVSRYYIIPDTEMCGLTLMPGEFTEGDRVRIVYDGFVAETSPARINKTYSITKLDAPATPPADDITPAPAGLQFAATVLEVNDGSILIEPLPGTVNHPGTNLIRVTRTLADSGVYVQDISVGDIVSILYDGMIAESYPGQINTVYDIQVLPDHPDAPKEPLPQWEISLEVTYATSTEALIVYHINNLGPGEVWTGYDYHLEALTDDGWVHYGYPPEVLAWESALLFHTSDHYPLDSQNQEIFVADWSRTADAPLPPGTYRYCKGVTICYDGEYTNQSLCAVFEVPADSPSDPGVHMEILNPTDTGATLAVTYNGGLMGELSTQGKYYLMVDVGGGMTRYGLSTGKVDWDDVRYTLKEGETVYLDVRWDHTADAPLPVGTYYVVLTVDQNVPDNGAVFQFQKYITEPFAIID